MSHENREVFGPYGLKILTLLLEAGANGATTKELSERLRDRYPLRQRNFVARSVAGRLASLRGRYVAANDKGVWHVQVSPPANRPQANRRVRLSSLERAVLDAIIRAGTRGITLDELRTGGIVDQIGESSYAVPAALASLIAYDVLQQDQERLLFWYEGFAPCAPSASKSVQAREISPVPEKKLLFEGGDADVHLGLTRPQRKILNIVMLAGDVGITIQGIAQELGKPTATGLTVSLGAMAKHGAVHQRDGRSSEWFYGPKPEQR